MKQAAAATFDFIEPMKALPVTDPPVGDWIYELKFDGYRPTHPKVSFSHVLPVS
jgi:ATP-dependent DNA ligase